ncbi:MAG TPA: Kae1-associated serine/threonine protein kinase [Candidatus Nanopusillus sp.]|nr:Kae1-associated serine/threonine protein kinase [Candidatus Nanopusillus sp.]
MECNLIGHGAEAKIYLIYGEKQNDNFKFRMTKEVVEELNKDIVFDYAKERIVLKYRYRKNYRHEIIDKNFRKYRTRRESRILSRLSNKINVPQVILVLEEIGVLVMEYIEGSKLSDILEKVEYIKIMEEVGRIVGMMHSIGIAHGDLTTSNLILSNNKVYLIDFGLSFFTRRIEDFAVDLHLLREALESKHWKIYQEAFSNFLTGYKKTFNRFKVVIKRLENIEKRGRYKNVS